MADYPRACSRCGVVKPEAAARIFTADGLFIGQSAEFFAVTGELAKAADAARHGS